MSAAELLAVMADPAAVNEHWRRWCREMVTRAAAREYERGLADGYHLAIADLKAWQQGQVRDTRLERRRWHVCCRRCRLAGCRPGCPDCQDRPRGDFGQAAPGDYPGREAAAA